MTATVSIAAGSVAEVTLKRRKKENDVLTHSKARAIVRVVQDSTATLVRATVVDDDGSAINLSSATGSLYFHASTQDLQSVTYQGTASWFTDGSDGKIQFPLTATEVGTAQTLRCEFEVQGYNGGNLITEEFLLRVVERVAVAP